METAYEWFRSTCDGRYRQITVRAHCDPGDFAHVRPSATDESDLSGHDGEVRV